MLCWVCLCWLGLCSGDTLQWTNAGGNPLWEEPRNWDLGRVPTASDDVVIDVPNIPGTVQIGAVNATARTLTIGGASGTLQRLLVFGSLTVGSGSIKPNGNLVLQSSLDQPFTSLGLFDGADRFLFISGSLSGPGSFTFTNITFSGPAEKRINSSVSISYLQLDPGDGQTSLITTQLGGLLVKTMKVTQGLTITGDDHDFRFNVTDTFLFDPLSSSALASLTGYNYLRRLEVTSGTVNVRNRGLVGQAVISAGAVLDLDAEQYYPSATVLEISGEGLVSSIVGNPAIGSVSGFGSLLVGGSSSLTLINVLNVHNFTFGGVSLKSPQGYAVNVIEYMDISKGQITTDIKAASGSLGGIFTLNNCTLTFTGKVDRYYAAQLELKAAASLVITSTAVVFDSVGYSNDYQIIPSDTMPGKQFIMDGVWYSNGGPLVIGVPTSGRGTFQMDAPLKIQGSTFSMGTLQLKDTTFYGINSMVSLGNVIDLGNGVIQNQGNFVTKNLTITTFNHVYGETFISTGSVENLVLQSGVFNVSGVASAGTVFSVGSLDLEGGTLCGGSLATTIAALNVNVTSSVPQMISSLTLNAPSYTIAPHSTVFYENVKLILGNPLKQLHPN